MKPKKRTNDAAKRMAAVDEKSCPVQRCLAYVDRFLTDVMCGRCLPCGLGTYEARARLKSVAEGRGDGEDLAALHRIGENMRVGSLCKKGKDAANYLCECLGRCAFVAHIEGRCPDRACEAFIEYRIVSDRCTMCGRCKTVCDYNAILGIEKRASYDTGCRPFEIRQKRCVKTGQCQAVCPTEAIIIVDKPNTGITGWAV